MKKFGVLLLTTMLLFTTGAPAAAHHGHGHVFAGPLLWPLLLPFAVAAQLARPDHPVVAVMGDGTFGFHMAEFDTAVRYDLPVIIVVGNDARWNAEYQIQLRQYGAERAKNCDLLPSRYDRVAEALGGFGTLVSTATDLPDALDRAYLSRRPACINVMIESVAAPIIRR